MATLERASYQTQKRYAEYCGLSGDQKPIEDINNGDEFQEIDTGFTYKFNTESMQWVKQPQSGGGGSGGTTDYTQLENKPSINGITLEGDKTTKELGIIPIVDLGEVSIELPVQIPLNAEQIQKMQKDNCIVSISPEADVKIYFNKTGSDEQGAIVFTSLINGDIFGLIVDTIELKGLLDVFYIEREWTLLGETDCSVVSGNIIYDGLYNFTEFLVRTETVKNESSNDSGYSFMVNDKELSVATPEIKSQSLSTEFYQWVIAKFNGLVWTVRRSNGAIQEHNLSSNYVNANCPYNFVLNVGAATKLELRAPLPQYQAVSGKITVWGR